MTEKYKDLDFSRAPEIIDFIEKRLKNYLYKDYPKKMVDVVVNLRKEESILNTKYILDRLKGIKTFSRED